MKTIGTNPTSVTGSNPDLIRDAPLAKPSGKDIGALVGGSGAPGFEQEEAHWRKNHAEQSFAQGRPYDEFHHAYRLGYEGYSHFGGKGQSFDETETKLRERYESENGSPQLPWNVARPASHAAWHKAAGQSGRK